VLGELKMAKVPVFDVNETLLDLGSLREPFVWALGDATSLGEWFARLLRGSLVAPVTDSYGDGRSRPSPLAAASICGRRTAT